MRILIFSPTVRAGTTQYTHCLANALADRGHSVWVATSVGYEMSGFSTKYEILEIVDRRRPQVGALMKLFQRVKRWKPDVIHLQGAQHPTTYLAFSYFLSAISSAPMVYTPQDVLPHYKRPNQTKALKFLYRRMSHVFFNAQQNIGSAEKLLGVKPANLTVLPLADLTAFVRETVQPVKPELPEEAQTVLFFGQIQERKGLGTLIEAFPRVLDRAPYAHLCVAGEAYMDLTQLRDRIQELGISKNVTMLEGYVPFPEMVGLFERADLVVLPYEHGWNSGVLISALGFNKPIVATRVGGFDEVIVDGECGLLVPPKSPDELGDAIARAFTDEGLKSAFKDGVPRAASRYSWEEIASQTEKAYSGVLKG